LYDRDARGVLHFYTALLGPRLFIEVVQRLGGYAGYGAVNVPTRMAASALCPPPNTGCPSTAPNRSFNVGKGLRLGQDRVLRGSNELG
jgi:hypothetical protein